MMRMGYENRSCREARPSWRRAFASGPFEPNHVYFLVHVRPAASLLDSRHGLSRNLQEVVGTSDSGHEPTSGGVLRHFQLGFR